MRSLSWKPQLTWTHDQVEQTPRRPRSSELRWLHESENCFASQLRLARSSLYPTKADMNRISRWFDQRRFQANRSLSFIVANARIKSLGRDFGGIPRAPVATDAFYRERFFETLESAENSTLATDSGPAVSMDFFNRLALSTQVTKKASPLNWQHGPTIYRHCLDLLSRLGSKETVFVLDIGSAAGYSAICLAKALEDAERAGVVISLDALAPNQPRFWNRIGDELGPRKRSEVLQEWRSLLERVLFLQILSPVELPSLGLERIHFAFVDGDHSSETVAKELRFIRERQLAGDQIVLDDISIDSFPELTVLLESQEVRAAYDVKVFGSASRGYGLLTRL